MPSNYFQFLRESYGQDASLNETLQEHDKKKHKGHFDPKTMSCKLRDSLKVDELNVEPRNEASSGEGNILHAIKARQNVRRSISDALDQCPDFSPAKRWEVMNTYEGKNIPNEMVEAVSRANIKRQFFHGTSQAKSTFSRAFSRPVMAAGDATYRDLRGTVAHEDAHCILFSQGLINGSVKSPMKKFSPIKDAAVEEANKVATETFGEGWRDDDGLLNGTGGGNDLLRVCTDMFSMTPNEIVESGNNGLVGSVERISDVLCAATDGQYFGGHTREYYRSDAMQPIHEIVANTAAAIVCDDREFLSRFPKTVALVKKLVYNIRA